MYKLYLSMYIILLRRPCNRYTLAILYSTVFNSYIVTIVYILQVYVLTKLISNVIWYHMLGIYILINLFKHTVYTRLNTHSVYLNLSLHMF